MDLNCSKLGKSEWEEEYELLTKTYILTNKGYKKSELHLNIDTFFFIIVDKNDLEVCETFFYRNSTNNPSKIYEYKIWLSEVLWVWCKKERDRFYRESFDLLI